MRGSALILKSQLEEARSKLDAARQNVLAVKENISLQVATGYEDYRASLSALENAREQLNRRRLSVMVILGIPDDLAIEGVSARNPMIECGQGRELRLLAGIAANPGTLRC